MISLSINNPKTKGSSYLGKLRQVGDSGCYILYDDGIDPKKATDKLQERRWYFKAKIDKDRHFNVIFPPLSKEV